MTSATSKIWICDRGQTSPHYVSDRLVLGRDGECGIIFENPVLSQKHCRIEPHQKGVKLTDLQSRNGLSVDGQLVSQVVLRPGQIAQVGSDFFLQVVVPGALPVPWPGYGSLESDEGEAWDDEEEEDAPQEDVQSLPAHVDASRRPQLVTQAPESQLERASGRTAAKTAPRGTAVLLVVGVALVAGLLFLFSQNSPNRKTVTEDPSTLALLEEVATAEGAQDFAAALELAERASELAVGEDLKARLVKRIQDLKASEGAASAVRLRIDEIVLHPPAEATYGSALSSLRSLKEAADKLLPPGRLKAAEETLIRTFEVRSEELLRTSDAQVRRLLAAGQYRDALVLVSDLQASGRLLGSVAGRVAALKNRIEAEATKASDRLLAECQSLSDEAIEKRLNEALKDFDRTPAEGPLRGYLALVRAGQRPNVVAAAPAIPEGEKIEAAPVVQLKAALADLVAKANTEVKRGQYAAAAEVLVVPQADVTTEEQVFVAARRGRIESMAEAKAQIIDAVRNKPALFREFDPGSGPTGRVEGADPDAVTILVDGGARVRWEWRRMTPQRVAALAARSQPTGSAAVGVAAILHELGDATRAERFLAGVLLREPDLLSTALPLATDIRGMERAPAEGFFAMGDRLLTASERDEALLVARLAALSELVVSRGGDELHGAIKDLQMLGERGAEAAVAALGLRDARLSAEILKLPALTSRVESIRAELFLRLQERRTAALQLIRDEKRYPYPYGPNGDEVQEEVNGLVNAVRDVWERSETLLAEWDPAFAALLQDWRECITLREGGEQVTREVPPLLADIRSRLSMATFAADPRAQTLYARNREVAAHNERLQKEEIISADELECYVATNAYREMMGLPAVMAEEAIVKCARGHSQEMQELNYFSHTSPVEGRASPGDRARLAGWGAGVSENIARGQPTGRAAVHSWIHSSGHHRNILGSGWTHLGVGKSKEGNFWTQNFSRGATKVPAKPGQGR
jgi:uncharacterized protein YkwD